MPVYELPSVRDVCGHTSLLIELRGKGRRQTYSMHSSSVKSWECTTSLAGNVALDRKKAQKMKHRNSCDRGKKEHLKKFSEQNARKQESSQRERIKSRELLEVEL